MLDASLKCKKNNQFKVKGKLGKADYRCGKKRDRQRIEQKFGHIIEIQFEYLPEADFKIGGLDRNLDEKGYGHDQKQRRKDREERVAEVTENITV